LLSFAKIALLPCAFLVGVTAWAQESEPAPQLPAAPEEMPVVEPEAPAVEPPAVGWLPTFAEMEAAGARIGEIRIEPQNIFDLSDERENNFVYRLANRLHVVTRPELIRRTLLFKTGEPVSARVIEESERLLRSTLQVYGVLIRPVAYREGVVDLEVLTRDRWTLDPSLSFSRTGGVNSDRLGIKEDNLLGTGTTLGYSRSSNVDRTSNTFNISHPHAFGPYVSASGAYADTSDGSNWSLAVNRPFYALDSRHAAGVSIDSSVRNEPVYVSGINTGDYRHKQDRANAFYGASAGRVDGWTRRHTLGLSYDHNRYSAIPGEVPLGEIPQDRTLTGPYYRLEVIQDRFRTGMNFDQIGKPEDFNVGLEFIAELGRSIAWLGSTRQQWLYSTSISKGADIGDRGLLRTSANFTGRYASGGEQQMSTLSTRYFHRHNGGYTFFGSFTASMVRNPDAPNPLTLGGDNDLRGYPLRYQSGNRSVLVSLEERVYTKWYPFRLFRVGGAVFYDGGRAWGGSNPNTANPGWLNDVGFGLRFLTDRSSKSNVLHIDLAFPLNRQAEIDAVQLLVYTKITL
jgi:outer membrane protein assembly factor BamA